MIYNGKRGKYLDTSENRIINSADILYGKHSAPYFLYYTKAKGICKKLWQYYLLKKKRFELPLNNLIIKENLHSECRFN